MSKKWNTEIFREYVFNNFGDEFRVVGEYTNNNEPISMYHKECGREFTVRPSNFKTRKRCPLCHRNFKKTTSQFKKEVFKMVGNEYEVISEYITAKDKIKMKHAICNKIYETTPDKFINAGSRCFNCMPNKPKNTDEHREEVVLITNNEYSLLGDYINSKTRTMYIHHACKTIFEKTPEVFLTGIRCPKCGLNQRSGKNHYRYNSELSKEERLQRDMFNGELKKWRNAIYKRDNYTCGKCGNFGSKLNAHHLNSWDAHKDKRFDVDNGITLCVSCHKKFHSIFGYGNNTKEQFKIFTAP